MGGDNFEKPSFPLFAGIAGSEKSKNLRAASKVLLSRITINYFHCYLFSIANANAENHGCQVIYSCIETESTDAMQLRQS